MTELMLIENPRRKKKKRKASSESYVAPSIITVLGLGYAVWALVKKSWTPWRVSGLRNRYVQRAVPRPQPSQSAAPISILNRR